MSQKFEIRVPASSANLGPAFDSLAIALDLWNECSFSVEGDSLQIELEGEGAESLATDDSNLIFVSFKAALEQAGQTLPEGIRIQCHNRIPLNSGLGSSAAALVSGLIAGNAFAGNPFSSDQLLQLAAEIEGHADNAAAALLGGLVLVTKIDNKFTTQQLPFEELSCVLLIPDIEISTAQARAALDQQVELTAAVANIGHAMALIKAFELGAISALREHMRDQLHQPQRLKLIPGAQEALSAANQAGAAVALSGAGPGLIAFVEDGREKAITETMRAPFAEQGIHTRQYLLKTSGQGAKLEVS